MSVTLPLRRGWSDEIEFLKWVARDLSEMPVRLFDYSGKVRKAMDKNFFGAEKWSKVIGQPVTMKRMSRRVAKQLLAIFKQPCPFEPHKLVKDTHILFPGVIRVKKEELTLMWLQNHRSYFFDKNVWYIFQSFANATLESGWHLVYHGAVPASTSLTYREQERMLPEEYRPTSVIEEIARRFLVSKCQKSFIWPSSICIRTRDLGLQDGRVCIDPREMPERSGLDICVYAENDRSDVLGVSAVRIVR